jgi:hypothetical protein
VVDALLPRWHAWSFTPSLVIDRTQHPPLPHTWLRLFLISLDTGFQG